MRDRRPRAFVAGVGTGGTVIGIGLALRAAYPGIWIAAVEPDESAVMSGDPPGDHAISGIGDGFIPAIAADGRGGVHPMIDEIVRVSTDEAMAAARHLATQYGFCVGVSSGANFIAALRLTEEHGPVVTVFPDGYTKYRSRGLMHCEPGRCPFEHELAVPVPAG